MTVEAILAGVVGLVMGVLIALWLDSQTLVRRVQAANSEKNKTQVTLQRFQIQHRATEHQLQVVQGDLTTAVQERTQLEETIARQLAEIEASREQLQTSISANEALRENLQETHDRLEELEGLLLTAEEKLAAAEGEANRLLGDGQLMEAEIAILEAQTEQLNAALAEAQNCNTELEQKAAAGEAQLAFLEAEKDAAQIQLHQAELATVEQSATIEALQKQLQEADGWRQQLELAQKKLQTADVHIQKLQDTVEDVQVKMSYSGKSELQLIRGIGPTYARRLNEFGIQSFADLADCKPEQIASIIKKKNWQSVDIQTWIDEAKALAATFDPNG